MKSTRNLSISGRGRPPIIVLLFINIITLRQIADILASARLFHHAP